MTPPRDVIETLLAVRFECGRHPGDWRGDPVTLEHLDQAISHVRASAALTDGVLWEMWRASMNLNAEEWPLNDEAISRMRAVLTRRAVGQ